MANAFETEKLTKPKTFKTCPTPGASYKNIIAYFGVVPIPYKYIMLDESVSTGEIETHCEYP